MMFNYGCFPQTWENPQHSHEDTRHPGDNDPLDAVEIGCTRMKAGEVAPVKVLGVLALIDDGETDWKLVVIRISDPLAAFLNDIDDVENHCPGVVEAIREYFRCYKNYQGKYCFFALNEECMPKKFATSIVRQCHADWKTLFKTNKDGTVKKSASSQALSGLVTAASPAAVSASSSSLSSSSSSSAAAASEAL